MPSTLSGSPLFIKLLRDLQRIGIDFGDHVQCSVNFENTCYICLFTSLANQMYKSKEMMGVQKWKMIRWILTFTRSALEYIPLSRPIVNSSTVASSRDGTGPSPSFSGWPATNDENAAEATRAFQRKANKTIAVVT